MNRPTSTARLFFLTLIATCFWLASAGAAEPLKVVSWNVEWFPGLRPTASAEEAAKHMKETQDELRKINPDIFIGLEMRDWAAFHELVSAVPGLTVHVVSSFRDPDTGAIRPQQIGIASKLTCRAAWWEAWKATVPNIARGFSFAALEQPDGAMLMVYGNHLKSNRGSETEEGAKDVGNMRNEQARQLLAHVVEMEKLFGEKKIGGWILAGDFNTNHDSQFPHCNVVEIISQGDFRNTWADTPREERLTWRGSNRFEPTTFDYFFTRGLGDLRASMIEVPREISDHLPVAITIPAQ